MLLFILIHCLQFITKHFFFFLWKNMSCILSNYSELKNFTEENKHPLSLLCFVYVSARLYSHPLSHFYHSWVTISHLYYTSIKQFFNKFFFFFLDRRLSYILFIVFYILLYIVYLSINYKFIFILVIWCTLYIYIYTLHKYFYYLWKYAFLK